MTCTGPPGSPRGGLLVGWVGRHEEEGRGSLGQLWALAPCIPTPRATRTSPGADQPQPLCSGATTPRGTKCGLCWPETPSGCQEVVRFPTSSLGFPPAGRFPARNLEILFILQSRPGHRQALPHPRQSRHFLDPSARTSPGLAPAGFKPRGGAGDTGRVGRFTASELSGSNSSARGGGLLITSRRRAQRACASAGLLTREPPFLRGKRKGPAQSGSMKAELGSAVTAVLLPGLLSTWGR